MRLVPRVTEVRVTPSTGETYEDPAMPGWTWTMSDRVQWISHPWPWALIHPRRAWRGRLPAVFAPWLRKALRRLP